MSEASVSSRDRLRAALGHREPDRIPLDFGSTTVTGIHVSCVAALRDHFGLERRPVNLQEPFQMLGLVEDDLRAAMGIDVTGVFPRSSKFGIPTADWKEWNFRGLPLFVPGNFQTRTEANGDILVFPQGDTAAPPSGRMPVGSAFFDVIIRQPEIDDEKLDPADNLEEFGPVTEADLEHLERSARAACATGCGVAAGFGGTSFGDIANVPAPALKYPKGIRDVSEWYISTRTRRGYIHRVFERQSEIALENLERIHSRIGDAVDVMYVCGTDFGTQTSAFCSVATFRELWFPYYRRVNDWVHSHTGWKCFKHSCGSVERFFESFIEAGFDIINPVQCSAAGMDPVELKRKYGSRLVFWGGGVDTQNTLPFGNPREVREQVLRRCEIFAPGGGFVFNAIHNLQAGTPVANIAAMLNAVHEFNGVSHV
ncbi:MAG: uroporphyrinogen decarboxylase family protein [Candidatus Sulfopaludibacter sp.]|nr:uroporphyrinogen decarboxylase family protein [Candidatus Sulfopaludibacter sp.]